MINFGHFLCIIQFILYLLTLVCFEVEASKKVILIFQSCWIMTILLLFSYHIFNGGVI